MSGQWIGILMILVLPVCFAKAAVAIDPVYPGKTWAKKPSAEVGLDEAKLKEFSAYLGGRGCVTRFGYMVYTWGAHTKRGDVASAAKPWYSHMLFKALEDGRIPSLDQPVIRWEPRLATINAALDHKDRAITWRHLANQTSCYQLIEEPGTAYCYNDWQMALFWDCLFKKVYGAQYETVDANVLAPILTGPLGCQDSPTMMAFGVKNRPGRLSVSPRDFARFGLLYMRNGNWRGKQLITPGHAAMAVTSPVPLSIPRAGRTIAEMIPEQRTIGSRHEPDNQTDHNGSYSWLWWINGIGRNGSRNWPDAPVDTYAALGHAGGMRAVVVIPSLDTVIAWNDTDLDAPQKELNAALKIFVTAVTAPSSRPAPDADKNERK